MPKNSLHPSVAPYRVTQNFLTRGATIHRLLQKTTLQKSDHVLEIGHGKGHLTRRLLDRCGQVTAVEIDPALCRRMREQCAHLPHLRLVEGDFLEMPLPRGEFKVFSNLPFAHTSAMVRKLTEGPRLPTDCWLIMEQGAALRFAGRPSESPASLRLKPFFDVDIAAFLSRREFHPMPGVDAALLHLHRRDRADIPPRQRDAFLRFIQAMSSPQKNARPLSPREVSRVLREAQLPMDATLSYVQWLCLFRRWTQTPKRGLRR